MSLTKLQKLALKRAASLAEQKVSQLRVVMKGGATFAMGHLNISENLLANFSRKNVESAASECVKELSTGGTLGNQMVRELEELQEILSAVLSEL